MEHVRYTRKRLAEILGVTEAQLERHESGALRELGGVRDVYGAADLSAYREALGLQPPAMPQRRQLFLNFKGGTGKTSLSVSYAHRLAELGHRVLLIDLDSQGHATKCVGYEGDDFERTLFDVLVKKAPVEDVVVETPMAELDLIPSNLRMSTVDLALMPLAGREYRLRKALESVTDVYDYIVLDAPPAFGLLNLNALMASDDLFVPVLPDFLSFHGLKLLFETLDDLTEDLDHAMARIFIVLNQFNPTTKIARSAREALETHFPEYLLPMVIRQCTKFAQASSEGMPLFAFDPTSKGAQDLQALIDHVAPVAEPALAKERLA